MRIFFCICTLIWLSGCAHKVVLAEQEHQELFNKRVVHIKTPTSNFSAMTFGNSLSNGFFGHASGKSFNLTDGYRIVKENEIQDPAILINKLLLEKIQNKYSVVVSETESLISEEKDVSKLSKSFSNYDYVLDTQTLDWGFLYLLNVSHYRVLYTAGTRLIDTKTEKVVAQSFCLKDSGSKNAPTYQQLLSNDAELLKNKLTQHAEECADSLYNDMFPVYDQNSSFVSK